MKKMLIVALMVISAMGMQAAQSERRPGWFSPVKAMPDNARDEIGFWGPKMSDHALFLYLGLDNKRLKNQAWNLHRQLERYMRRFSIDPSQRTINQIIPLLRKLKAFKKQVLRTLKSGKWIGFNYPSFVEHMILELNYFMDKLADKKFTLEKELAFWNTERGGEAAVTAHLLDPAADIQVDKATQLAKQLQHMPKEEVQALQELSLKLYKEFEQFTKEGQMAQKSGKLKSILNPKLVQHVIEEGQRAIETISSFKSSQNPQDKLK